MEAQLLNIVQRAEENFKVCQTRNLGESQSMPMPVRLAYVDHDGMRNACPNSMLTVRSAELTCSITQRAEPCPVSLHWQFLTQIYTDSVQNLSWRVPQSKRNAMYRCPTDPAGYSSLFTFHVSTVISLR